LNINIGAGNCLPQSCTAARTGEYENDQDRLCDEDPRSPLPDLLPGARRNPGCRARRRRRHPLGFAPVGFDRPAPTAVPAARAGLGVGGVRMRALGPGSVSSFLKIILDVVYVALWISL